MNESKTITIITQGVDQKSAFDNVLGGWFIKLGAHPALTYIEEARKANAQLYEFKFTAECLGIYIYQDELIVNDRNTAIGKIFLVVAMGIDQKNAFDNVLAGWYTGFPCDPSYFPEAKETNNQLYTFRLIVQYLGLYQEKPQKLIIDDGWSHYIRDDWSHHVKSTNTDNEITSKIKDKIATRVLHWVIETGIKIFKAALWLIGK